jgi:uncharacterized protein YktB (UPF0637 family)
MGIAKKMKPKPDPHQINNVEVGIYECEIHLKFRLIEEKSLLSDRDQLLQVLLDALTEGSDEFLETLQTHVNVNQMEISELKASPQMRRQLMRLRNLQSSSETNTISIKIPEESLQKLQETANLLEVPIEELVQMRVEEALNQPQASFKDTIDYVLKKNAELYNRLA